MRVFVNLAVLFAFMAALTWVAAAVGRAYDSYVIAAAVAVVASVVIGAVAKDHE